MAFSTQRLTVEDTPLALLGLSIEYQDESEITVYVNDLIYTDWTWADSTHLAFDPALAVGTTLLVQRATDLSGVKNVFGPLPNGGGNAQFVTETLDENFQQMLYICQEAKEGSTLSDIFNDLNLHGYKISNVGAPVSPNDAATKDYVDTQVPQAQAAADAAAASAAAALTSKNAASASATAAAASAVTASAAATSDAVVNVNAHLSEIEVVSEVTTEIQEVGDNIAAITAVGTDLTGSPIEIDYGSIADPATNPAAPGGVLGAVYNNAENITTVAENIDNVNLVAENIEDFTTPATTSQLGVVKPDGSTITVDPDGTIHSTGGGSGPPAPIDLSTLSSDTTLEVNQQGYIDITSATSVPLYIATADKEVYKIELESTSADTTNPHDVLLLPNNTSYTNMFVCTRTASVNSSTVAVTTSYRNGMPLSLFASYKIAMEVTVSTICKVGLGQAIYNSTSGLYHLALLCAWLAAASTNGAIDTSTTWTSLGTITFAQACTGRITVTRLR